MFHQQFTGFRFFIGHTQLLQRIAYRNDSLPETVGGKFKSTPSFQHFTHSSYNKKLHILA